MLLLTAYAAQTPRRRVTPPQYVKVIAVPLISPAGCVTFCECCISTIKRFHWRNWAGPSWVTEDGNSRWDFITAKRVAILWYTAIPVS